MEFKDRLRQLRSENKTTQKDLAKAIGTTQGAIYFWEKGTEPTAGQLLKLSQYFNVSVDYLIGRTDDFGNQRSEMKEELAPSERELLKKYRAISADGKEKALDYIDLIFYDEERKRTPGGKIGGKWS